MRSCGDKIVSTDGQTDEPISIVPFDLRRGTKKELLHFLAQL